MLKIADLYVIAYFGAKKIFTYVTVAKIFTYITVAKNNRSLHTLLVLKIADLYIPLVVLKIPDFYLPLLEHFRFVTSLQCEIDEYYLHRQVETALSETEHTHIHKHTKA